MAADDVLFVVFAVLVAWWVLSKTHREHDVMDESKQERDYSHTPSL